MRPLICVRSVSWPPRRSTEARSGQSGSSGPHGCTTRERSPWSTAPPRSSRGHSGTAVNLTETSMAELNDNAPDVAPDSETREALDALQREKDALQDRLLRTAAEFDNYRKRMERERRELADYTAADVLKDLLPIL